MASARTWHAIADPGRPQERYEQVARSYYEKGKALSTAAAFESDDVIDPAQTRHVLTQDPGPEESCRFRGRQRRGPGDRRMNLERPRRAPACFRPGTDRRGQWRWHARGPAEPNPPASVLRWGGGGWVGPGEAVADPGQVGAAMTVPESANISTKCRQRGGTDLDLVAAAVCAIAFSRSASSARAQAGPGRT